MSLIPFILDLADELNEFNRSLVSGMDVDDFGFGMYPNELPQSSPRRPRTVSQLYLLPNTRGRHHPYWRSSGTSSKACCNKAADKEVAGSSDKENSVVVKPATAAYSVVNKNGFQVSMNVKQFSPNELTVKTIDNCIVVEGQHDEKEDGHGVISRHFVRKYMLPKGFDPNEVLSTLSSDGILTVKAPPPTKTEEHQLERVVHIQHTGPAQLAAKDVGSSSNKEKPLQQPQQTTTTAATTTTTQTPTQQQQKQHEEEIPKLVNERNGDANANEINPESETATEAASIEPMLLVSNVVTAAAIDAMVTASAAAANEENKNGGEHEDENNTNAADIPMVDVVAIPAGVIESVVLVNATAGAGIEEGVVDGAAAAAEMDSDTPADEVVIPTPPTAGDLVAAADAAILLTKTQCENGNKAAAEELAN